MFLFYTFKRFTKIYGYKIFHFLTSKDFQIIVNIWNIKHYVYNLKIYDESVEINHNANWPYIPGHPYIILIVGGSGLGKANVSFELNKASTPRYSENLTTNQRSIRIKVSITYWQKRKNKHWKFYKIQKPWLIIHQQLMMFMKI